MSRDARGRCLLGLCVVALLLAGCGRESDLHTAATLAATATAVPEPAGSPGTAAGPTLAPFPTPVPTQPWRLTPAPACPAEAQPGGTYAGAELPVPVPTTSELRLEPPAFPGQPLDGPATFLIPPDCSGRVLQARQGDTIDILIRERGRWSGATDPARILQSVGLADAPDGAHWRFQAAQPGRASLSVYVDWRHYLNLGVVVK